MPELTPYQQKAIELLVLQIQATLDLHNHLFPEAQLTFEEAMKRIPRTKELPNG